MQSETADFAIADATWQTGQNIRVVLDSGLLCPLYRVGQKSDTSRTCITLYERYHFYGPPGYKHDVIHKPEVHNIALSSDEH